MRYSNSVTAWKDKKKEVYLETKLIWKRMVRDFTGRDWVEFRCENKNITRICIIMRLASWTGINSMA